MAISEGDRIYFSLPHGKKHEDVQFEDAVSPKLTDQTKSHVATKGWEDSLPPRSADLTVPERMALFGGNLPELSKVSCSTWNNSFVTGFEKQAKLKHMAITGALALGGGAAKAGDNILKSNMAKQVTRAAKSQFSKEHQAVKNYGKSKIRDIGQNIRGYISGKSNNGSPMSQTIQTLAGNQAITPKGSPVSVRLKDLRKVKMNYGSLGAEASKKGIGINYKDFGGKVNRNGSIAATYKPTPNLSISGYAGKKDSGASIGWTKNF